MVILNLGQRDHVVEGFILKIISKGLWVIFFYILNGHLMKRSLLYNRHSKCPRLIIHPFRGFLCCLNHINNVKQRSHTSCAFAIPFIYNLYYYHIVVFSTYITLQRFQVLFYFFLGQIYIIDISFLLFCYCMVESVRNFLYFQTSFFPTKKRNVTQKLLYFSFSAEMFNFVVTEGIFTAFL